MAASAPPSSPAPLRVGILMGGPSNEREVSFAGGRTVYDVLDKRYFQPVPIFIDSLGAPILLNWQHVYKGTTRDFYPPAAFLPDTPFQLYAEQLNPSPEQHLAMQAAIGTPLTWSELPQHIDLAFLTLHGPAGEDGSIQGLLQWLGIPYTGAGIRASALGLDKAFQRPWLTATGHHGPPFTVVRVEELLHRPETAQARVQEAVGLPCVAKNPVQGSSVGVQIVRQATDFIRKALLAAFYYLADAQAWAALSPEAQHQWLAARTDPREGLALPLELLIEGQPPRTLHRPQELRQAIESLTQPAWLRRPDAPNEILVEAFVEGQEFSVIVLQQPDGSPLALPPTQIIKQEDLFDYRSKYLPGLARKLTPINLPDEQVADICAAAEALMRTLGCEVYARLDGIRTPQGALYFNDPNTTSGMLPGSFFFHQAAEVGLAPTPYLTYIIQASLQARSQGGPLAPTARGLQNQLTTLTQASATAAASPTRVGVFLGGYGSERHISVESGRNVVEKLTAHPGYAPTPIYVLHHKYLTEAQRQQLALPEEPPFSFWQLPINLLLKDNADDIAEKIAALAAEPHVRPIIQAIRSKAAPIVQAVSGEVNLMPRHIPLGELPQHMAVAFNIVHGRPGEDGALAAILQQLGIPFNGSLPGVGAVTIDKYATNEALLAAGLKAPQHALLSKATWQDQGEAALQALITQLDLPLIAKPHDDGCSAAVVKIKRLAQLQAYAQLSFRAPGTPLDPALCAQLGISPRNEFPAREQILLERLIQATPTDARIIEITVGLTTTRDEQGLLHYTIFEPSETLAAGEVLSLEEKFLAGEGLNITPARFSPDAGRQAALSVHIRGYILKAAQTLGLEGFARIDAFAHLPPDDAPASDAWVEFIEVNLLPAMTPATCIFHQAALAEFTPAGFIDHILQQALQRKA